MGIFKKITSFILLTILVGTMLVPMETQASTGVALNSTNFPDAKFLNFLKTGKRTDGIKFDSDANGELSASEIGKITSLNVSYNAVGEKIYNLKGIEKLTSLVALDCKGQYLTALDVSKNVNLTEINCSYNDLTSLNLSNNKKLYSIICNSNKLTSLTIGSNTVLTNLSCQDNQLTSLDVSKCVSLERLECANNKITALNITNCINLIKLSCENNQINFLDFTDKHINVSTVTCQNNAMGRLYFYRIDSSATVNCANQKINATMYKDGSKKFIDMSAYGINSTKIADLTGATYDADAKCFVLTGNAAVGSVVKYSYKTGQTGKRMDVTITISSEKSGKYPTGSTVQPTTTVAPTPTQPPTTKPQPTTTAAPTPTQPPTTKPQPTTTASTPVPTTKPQATSSKETSPSTVAPTVKPTQKPTGQPVTDAQGETKTNPAGEIVTEPITEPSGEITSGDVDNDGTTTDTALIPTIGSGDGPADIMEELKPIIIVIGAVFALIIVVVVVIIIVSAKKNGKDKKKDDKNKYQYNNRIKY